MRAVGRVALDAVPASAAAGCPAGEAATGADQLTEAERQRILAVLRSEDYCDLAPAQVWARLLDDGFYLCSISIDVPAAGRRRGEPRSADANAPIRPARSQN